MELIDCLENSANYLEQLRESIELSKGMLLLEDDYDGEGYLKPSKENWQKATNWLFNFLQKSSISGKFIPIPDIFDGPGDGSIDIYWDGDKKLLMNITESDVIPYYGFEPYTNNEIKGQIIIDDDAKDIINWLKN